MVPTKTGLSKPLLGAALLLLALLGPVALIAAVVLQQAFLAAVCLIFTWTAGHLIVPAIALFWIGGSLCLAYERLRDAVKNLGTLRRYQL